MLIQSADHFNEQYNGREANTHSPHSSKERPLWSSHNNRDQGNSLFASLKSLMVSSPLKSSSSSSVQNDNSAKLSTHSTHNVINHPDREDGFDDLDRVEGEEEEDEFSDWDDDEDSSEALMGTGDYPNQLDPLMSTQDSVTLSVDANRGVMISTLCLEVVLLQKNCAVLTDIVDRI
jgi:hypothetical protein